MGIVEDLFEKKNQRAQNYGSASNPVSPGNGQVQVPVATPTGNTGIVEQLFAKKNKTFTPSVGTTQVVTPASSLNNTENEMHALREELMKIENGTAIYTDDGKARAAEIRSSLSELTKKANTIKADPNLDYSAYLEQKHEGKSAFGKGVGSIGTTLAATAPVIVETASTAAKNAKERDHSDPNEIKLAELREELMQINNGTAIYTEEGKARAKEIEAEIAYLQTAGKPVDMTSTGMRMMSEANWLRNEATKDIESPVGKLAADAGLGIAQSAAVLPTAVINPAAPLVIMGATAGAQKMYEVSESGGSAGEALARGVVAGGIEALTEKLPVDTLMDIVKVGGKSAVKNMLKQAGVEATEEGISYTMNYIADKAAKDPDATWSWVDFANSVAAGGLSGMFFGLGGTAVGGQNTSTQTTVSTAGQIEVNPSTGIPGQNGASGFVEGLPTVEVEPLPDVVIGGMQNKTAPVNTGADYTVERDASGNTYIQINADVLRGVPESEWKATVRNTIQKIFGNGLSLPRGTIFSNRKGRGEYTNGSYSRMLERTDPEMYADKLRMSAGSTGIVENASNVRYEDASHDRADDIVGFNRGDITVSVRGNGYNGDVLTAIYSDGKEVFFDINNLNRQNIETASPERYAAESGFTQTEDAVSITTVPQAEQGVKNEYTQEQKEQSVESVPAEQSLLGFWEVKNPEAGIAEGYWDSIMEEQPLPFSESNVDGYIEALLADVNVRLGKAVPKGTPITEEYEPSSGKKTKRAKQSPKEITVVKEIVEDPEVGAAGDGVAAIAKSLTSSGISYNKDLARNLDAAAGGSAKLREDLRNLIERPFLAAKASYANGVRAQLNNLKAVMDELGIKKGSKESAAVQRYGEKQYQDKDGEVHEYTEAMLRSEFPNTWQNIVKAEQYARQVYDSYVDRINATLESIYPRVLDKAIEEADKYTSKAALCTEMAAEQKKTYDSLAEREQNLQERLSKTKEGTQSYANTQNTIQRLGEQMEKVQARIKSLQDQADLCNAKSAAVHARIASGDILRNKRLAKRSDYFHHFNEMAEGWAGLANILTTPSDVDSTLAGTSDYTKPKTKWAGFMQGRKGGKYTEDAVGGLLKYIPQAEYKVNLDPIIAENRKTIKTLAEETEESRNANKFIEWMTDWTNDLAGKTNPFDRAIQKVVGRKATAVAKWLSSRAKANAVVGNVRSATAQVFNLPNAAVYIKSPAAWAKGAKIYTSALTGDATAKSLFEESGFLSERYMDDAISQFDEGVLKQPEKFANWMLTVGDKEVAKLIWASAYEQGRANGTTDPVEYADDITRRSIAGRGVGEVPLLQKATYTQLFAPFQIEVNNTWQLMKEAGGDKNWGGLLAMFALSFLMNTATRELFGYEVGIDPFNALIESVENWDSENVPGSIASAAGRMGGELLSNMPFGAQIGSVAVSDETAREKLFGDADPSRFGTGNIGINALADFGMSAYEAITEQDVSKLDLMTPLTNFALPYGGKQVGRMVEGAQSLGLLPTVSKDGAASLPDAASLTDNGGLRFAIDEENAADVAKLFAFGPFSTSGGMEYLEQGYSALGETQTAAAMEAAKKGVDLIDYMTAYRGMSGMSESEKRSFIQKMQVSDEEKAYIYRYSMLSSTTKENERTLFDDLIADGVDAGTVGTMLMAMKDAENSSDKLDVIAQTDLPDELAKNMVGFVMGTELKTEKGNDTEYAKLLKAMDTALGASEAIQMKVDGLDLDKFLEFEGAGVDASAARDLLEKLDQLTPKSGSETVTDLQKYRVVVNSKMSEQDQMDALGVMMGENEFGKLQVGYDYGVAPDVYVDFKETMPKYDADSNGNYKQVEIKAAIDAMGIDDVGMKAALWQLANKSWKPEKNPYSVSVGRKVYDAMHSEG